MPSVFRMTASGPVAKADPNSQKRWGITCWIEGRTFATVTWSISPSGPTLSGSQINGQPLTIDGREYAAGKVASVTIAGLAAGTIYTVTARATFDDGQIDDRSFRLVAEEQ